MNSKSGYTVTGPNGNTIFLPAGGYWDDDNGGLKKAGTDGVYWSSSLYTPSPWNGRALQFRSGTVLKAGECSCNRYCGAVIRPVMDK